MLTFNFMINTSDDNYINKSFQGIMSLAGVVKEPCSIENPVLNIKATGSIINCNYVKIPAFGRSYFVKDIVIKENGHYDVYCEVDVLESFKSIILNNPCIVEATESSGYDDYLPHESFVSTVKHKTDIIKFTGGLNDTGEFILITAGG